MPRLETSAAAIDDLGSCSWSVFIPQVEGVSCGLLFHYCPACLNVFVSRVVQTGLPEFGTLLAHIQPQGTPVDALENLINLFGFIALEWSHPPGSNRRPTDYESVALPAELGWLVLLIITTCRDLSNLS